MALIKQQVLDFNRFEFKYVLPKRLRQEVEQELGHFVEFDPFVAGTPQHRYFVRSLYFDDPAFTAFHDKIDGLKKRSKFRIRTYSTDPLDEAPQFLEQKGRYNNRVFKNRVEIGGTLVDRIGPSAKPVIEQLATLDTDNKVLARFQYEYFRKGLQPVALIDYHRRPYVSKYDSEFRITFDEELRATNTCELYPSLTAINKPVKTGFTIMEVKFNRHIPAWFHRIIQSYELRRVSISKICEGMQTLGLASDCA
jgi:hypothetical protein